MKLSDQITRRQLFLVAFGTSQATGGLTSVDLAATRDDSQVVLTASDGSAAPISGADGAAAGVMTVADKATLDELAAANIREFSARSDVPTTAIGPTVTHLRAAGFFGAGDGGGALYKRAGAEPSHNLKVQSADGAWWEIAEPNVITFQACGGVEGDNAGNGAGNVTAFNNFIGYLQDQAASGFLKGPTLLFPMIGGSAVYHFNTHLNVKAVVHITGPGGWNSPGVSNLPRLVFPTDSHGIIVHRANTIDDTTEAAGYGADGSLIENLTIVGGGNTDTTGHGVWIRAFCTVRHVEARNFAKNGFNIVGAIGGGTSAEGNPSLFKLENCLANNNGGNGIYISGADANAGHTIGCDVRDNARWGLWDDSALGNSHFANHETSNGGDSNGGNSGASCVADYGGSSYILNVDASEADAVATTPGTDKSVWIENSGASGGVTWTGYNPSGTFKHGGGYRSTGASARTVFVGCYTEPGKGSQFKLPTLWYGGHETFDTYGTHGGFAPNVNEARMRGKYSLNNTDCEWPLEPDREAELQLNWNRSALMQLVADSDTGNGLRLAAWEESNGMWKIEHGSNIPVKFSTSLTSATYGRSSAIGAGEIAFERGIFLGSFSGARHMTNATAMPSSGAHARGEIYWNQNMAEGAPLGWVCVTAGTPGTWAEIRGVGTQQSHIAGPSGGTTVDAEARNAVNSILGVLEHFGLTAAN